MDVCWHHTAAPLRRVPPLCRLHAASLLAGPLQDLLRAPGAAAEQRMCRLPPQAAGQGHGQEDVRAPQATDFSGVCRLPSQEVSRHPRVSLQLALASRHSKDTMRAPSRWPGLREVDHTASWAPDIETQVFDRTFHLKPLMHFLSLRCAIS